MSFTFYGNENSPDKMTVASSLNWIQLTFCEKNKLNITKIKRGHTEKQVI